MSSTEKEAFKGKYTSYLLEDDDDDAVFAAVENEHAWKDHHTASAESLWEGPSYSIHAFGNQAYLY